LSNQKGECRVIEQGKEAGSEKSKETKAGNPSHRKSKG